MMAKKYFQISLLFVMLILSNKIYSQTNSNKMEHTETQKTENRIQAILTLDMENIPSNFQEIIKQEQEVVAQWKAEGFLEHLYLRLSKNGAVLIFKGIDEQKAKELMEKLPLYQLKKSVEYFNLLQQF
jgi:muconolactone D-isomerase